MSGLKTRTWKRRWIAVATREGQNGHRGVVYALLWPFAWENGVPPRRAACDYIFHGGLLWGSRELHMWLNWARLSCRAWNACMIAAMLTGLQPHTPAGILADAVDDANLGHRLATDLRRWYHGVSCKSHLGPACYQLPELPAIPADLMPSLNWLP